MSRETHRLRVTMMRPVVNNATSVQHEPDSKSHTHMTIFTHSLR